MIFSLIAILVVVLLALYLSTQGLFSAILELAAALFGGLLALGLYEYFAGFMEEWRPDYARGVAFLGCFFVGFSVIRFVVDKVVVKNIVLPPLIDRIAGGAVGLVAALFIVGTAVTGIEMLPVQEYPLQYGSGKVTTNEDGSAPRLFAARFATGMLYMGSEAFGGLGATPFGSVHPDLNQELPGYRHTVSASARQSLNGDLVSVADWMVLDGGKAKGMGIPVEGGDKKYMVVRTVITKGTEQPHVSWDVTADPTTPDLLLLTPSQVRLVVQNGEKYRQYYPVGHLRGEFGYEALVPTYTSYVAEDYNSEGKAYHDWVFEVEEGAGEMKPMLIEVKHGGRVMLNEKGAAKTMAALTRKQIPERKHVVNAGELELTVKRGGAALAGAEVYVIRSTIKHGVIDGMVKDTHEELMSKFNHWENSTGGWGSSARGKPGVPGQEQFRQYQNRMLELRNSASDANIAWAEFIVPAFIARMTPEGKNNLRVAKDFYEKSLAPAMEQSKVKKATVDAQGRVEIKPLAPGEYVVCVVGKSENLFVVKVGQVNIKKKEKLALTYDLSTGQSSFEVYVP